MAKKSRKIAKVREFWKHNLNPVTGFRAVARGKNSSGIVTFFKRVIDQATIFKPKGF